MYYAEMRTKENVEPFDEIGDLNLGMKCFYFMTDLKRNFRKIINFEKNEYCGNMHIYNEYDFEIPFNYENKYLSVGPFK